MDLHRYVILRHDGIPDPHFDLMVEATPGGLLLTWRTPEWPIERETNVTKLGEHRRMYLEYEGDVSRGRGTVRRVAEGTCELRWRTAAEATIRIVSAMPASSSSSSSAPVTIQLRHLDDDHWLATPV